MLVKLSSGYSCLVALAFACTSTAFERSRLIPRMSRNRSRPAPIDLSTPTRHDSAPSQTGKRRRDPGALLRGLDSPKARTVRRNYGEWPNAPRRRRRPHARIAGCPQAGPCAYIRLHVTVGASASVPA